MNRLDAIEARLNTINAEFHRHGLPLPPEDDLSDLLAVARAVVEYIADNDSCPVCGVWLDGVQWAHADGCALAPLLEGE